MNGLGCGRRFRLQTFATERHSSCPGRLHLQQLSTALPLARHRSGTAFAFQPAWSMGLGNYYTPTLTASCTAQPTSDGRRAGHGYRYRQQLQSEAQRHLCLDREWRQARHHRQAVGPYRYDRRQRGQLHRQRDHQRPQGEEEGSAICAANFTVKAKPMNPPQVSCSVNPSTVKSAIRPPLPRVRPARMARRSLATPTPQPPARSAAPEPRPPSTRQEPVGSDQRNRHRDGCTQPVGQRHLLGGRRSTAAAADVQQDQLYPVPGSEETVARG